MNQQDLKRLKDKWYKKLEATGFEDIEDVNSPREMLKRWDSTWFFNNCDELQFKTRHRYFIMATHFLNSHDFESRFERRIWSLHCEGFSCREIASVVDSSKTTVNDIIVFLKKIMRRGF